MRVLIAPDSFGGTLTAVEAAKAIASGWRQRAPADELVLAPMSDGGAGFVDAVHATIGGDLVGVVVRSAHGVDAEPMPAAILICDDIAYVECAQASAGRPVGDAETATSSWRRAAHRRGARCRG